MSVTAKQLIAAAALALALSGTAQATLTTIGTATYDRSNYNLIYDDNNNGHGLVWLDYTHSSANWSVMTNWADSLNYNNTLTYNLKAGYSVNWDAASGWRLPATVDGPAVYGYNGTGTYTYGYNITSSELGHLYYTELENKGYVNTAGASPQPGWGLNNTGDFDNLYPNWYWSGTEFADNPYSSWTFYADHGTQMLGNEFGTTPLGIAVRSGQVVQEAAPVPEPSTMLLLGAGIGGLALYRRRQTKK